MEYTSKLNKTLASRLADAVYSEGGTDIVRLLRLAGFFGPLSANLSESPLDDMNHRPGNSQDSSSNSERIGIWEKKQEDGKTYFVRTKEALKDWNFWANLGRIDAKGTKKRVVLIGESVARGYLYDPQFTPAMALERILQSQCGETEIEVIDLARTNLGFELRELAISALQLEPDAVVIFSGNNWRTLFPPSPRDIPEIAGRLADRGMAGLKNSAEQQLADEVTRVAGDVCSFYKQRGIPLVWIVPEFNLADWRDPLSNAPHLADDGNLKWIRLQESATKAFEAGDYAEAENAAREMVALDEGTCVAGLYILADCKLKGGDTVSARAYLEAARDAVIWDVSRSVSPRMWSVSRKALLETAAQYGSDIVDVPVLFQEYLHGEIPGRRLFLDYCHLTTEGIQVTMSAAAASVLRLLTGSQTSWTDLTAKAPSPASEIEAEAAFLAAIHNAHWWQSHDLALHFCRQALQHSPDISKIMLCLLDLQTQTTPMLMCKSAQKIAELGSPLIQHYLLRYNHQQLDRLLLDAVVTALAEAGVESADRLNCLRRDVHSIVNREIDLLSFYYNSAALQPQEVMWVLPRRDWTLMKDVNYYRAYGAESKFVFVGEANRPVKFSLTCRLQNHESPQAISLLVNQEHAGGVLVNSEWTTWNILVPAELIKDGINDVSIVWPMPEFVGRNGYKNVMNDLIEKRAPEFLTVFGEIHTFTVVDGVRAQAASPVSAHIHQQDLHKVEV